MSTIKWPLVSCPCGNTHTYRQLDSDQLISMQTLKDGAGLTLYNDTKQFNTTQQLVTTSSKGNSLLTQQHEVNFKQVRWDNHLTAIDVVSITVDHHEKTNHKNRPIAHFATLRAGKFFAKALLKIKQRIVKNILMTETIDSSLFIFRQYLD